MRKYEFSSKAVEPRVLCVSQRAITPLISRCLGFEFEDLIGDVDYVDVIAPVRASTPDTAAGALRASVRMARRLAARVSRRLASRLEAKMPITGLRRAPRGLAPRYALYFVGVETVGDLYSISPNARWTSRASTSICYIDEIYTSDVPELGSLVQILKQFDHIILAHHDSVQPLAEATGRPCHYLAPSIDALAFCPYPRNTKRVIDFYAMGRRDAQTHQVLQRIADATDRYYMYDTVGNSPVSSFTEHRARLAEMIKRTRFFLVNPAQYTDPKLTGGQQELGFRFFEGAAAGAVLIGNVPDSPSFDEHFGWPDAVIPVQFDSPDVADVIADLDADPIRLDTISKTNAINSLRRHDHVYRWGAILAIAGLPETSAMQHRRQQLEDLAASIERTMAKQPSRSERDHATSDQWRRSG